MCEKNHSNAIKEVEVTDEYATRLIKQTDPEGSSTGVPDDETQVPMQDACDL